MFLCLKKGIIALLLCSSMISYSQVVSSFLSSKEGATTNAVNSPTASAFRVFGSFPASNFIGVIDVSIPIHSKGSNVNGVDISMKYHNGMGNKIETIPTILGLGWHLDIGGAITLVESKKREAIYDDVTIVLDDPYALQRENWNTKEYLNELIGPEGGTPVSIVNTSRGYLQQTVYSINFNGYSGELYFDHNEKPKFRSKSNKKLLIEIEKQPHRIEKDTIKLPALASYITDLRFYIPKEGDIKKITLIDEEGVRYEFGGAFSATEFSRVGHSAYKAPRNNAFDIPNPITWNLTKIIYPNKDIIEFKYIKQGFLYSSKVWSDLVTDKWNTGDSSLTTIFGARKVHINSEQGTLIDLVYLDEVITPKERFKFNYNEYSQPRYLFAKYDELKNARNAGGDMHGFVDVQIELKKIFFFKYHDVGKLNFADLSQPMKQLNFIEVFNSEGEKSKKINFEYFTFNYQTRPMLYSLNIEDLEAGVTQENSNSMQYNFRYKMPNQNVLPPYQSYNKDDYGFYSTKNDYIGFISNPYYPEYSRLNITLPFRDNLNLRQQYVENRKPEISQYNDLQLLEEITYPTGGRTKFEYESNMYGGIAKNYPFIVEANSNQIAKPAGGVRIKSAKSFDTNGTIVKSTSYKYVKDYYQGGNASSGVLTHVPTHFEFIEGNYPFGETRVYHIDYFNWNSDDIYPADRLRGNHIMYSEVTEIDDMDGSFTTYEYKNFDNGYHDHPILNYATHYEFNFQDELGNYKEFWQKRDLISMELERGQLLSKTYFKPIFSATGSRGEKVKEMRYQYDDNPNRFEQYIRRINAYDNHLMGPLHGGIPSYTYIASKIYTYTPYLTKETEIDYNGTASIVKKETSYKYNEQYKALIEKEEKIGDKIYKTVYKYPFDFMSQSVYEDMEKKHIISPVILEEHYINNEKIVSQKNNYAKWFTAFGWNDFAVSPSDSIITPQNNVLNPPVFELTYWPLLKNIEKQIKQVNWEKEVDFLSYDSKHNVLSSRDKTGFETNYIWGYNRSLPVWAIANVSYSSISSLLGNKISKIGGDLVPLEADVQAVNTLLKQSPDLKEAVIHHYLYDPIKGLIYKENERGGKEYYEYDGFGRLKKVQDSKKNTVIEYEYNYKQ
ncbi:sugar-binding protein [Myroides sp. 1354]|nr:sugar-binding protein [Myroides sp. R163-1]MDM1056952.1 sugar-binding protein [Myroides sp. 1354]MDM1070147.1 sugar-binding protein [Myroides sp. 1372]